MCFGLSMTGMTLNNGVQNGIPLEPRVLHLHDCPRPDELQALHDCQTSLSQSTRLHPTTHWWPLYGLTARGDGPIGHIGPGPITGGYIIGPAANQPILSFVQCGNPSSTWQYSQLAIQSVGNTVSWQYSQLECSSVSYLAHLAQEGDSSCG